MSIGNQPTQQAVNSELGSLAEDLRSVCERIADFQTWVVSFGEANLETLGFTAGDAADVITASSYLNTVAGVYKGTATQATLFDFDNALSGLWGAS